MAVIFEMANSASTGSGGTSDHVNLDLGGPTNDGIDRLVIVAIAWSDDTIDGAALTLVQYGGLDMNFHSSRSAAGGNLEIYYLTDNRAGTAGVSVAWAPNPPSPTALVFAVVAAVAYKFVTPTPAVPFAFTATAAVASQTISRAVQTTRQSKLVRLALHMAVIMRSPLAQAPNVGTGINETMVWNNGADDGTTSLQAHGASRIFDGTQPNITMIEPLDKTAGWASIMVAINEQAYPSMPLLCAP